MEHQDANPPPEALTPEQITQLQSVVEGFLTQGLTLADLKGIPAADLEAVYAGAWQHLMEGRAADALPDLALLVAHNPWDARFEFALALTLQQLGRHEPALQHYLQAVLLDPDNAACTLRLGECLEALGQAAAAQEAYRRCIDLSWQSVADAELRRYAQLGLDRLYSGAGNGC